jgi:hypothetical protein
MKHTSLFSLVFVAASLLISVPMQAGHSDLPEWVSKRNVSIAGASLVTLYVAHKIGIVGKVWNYFKPCDTTATTPAKSDKKEGAEAKLAAPKTEAKAEAKL